MCVKLVFDSKVPKVQVSPILHSLVAWLPTTRPTLKGLLGKFLSLAAMNRLVHFGSKILRTHQGSQHGAK